MRRYLAETYLKCVGRSLRDKEILFRRHYLASLAIFTFYIAVK